MTPGILPKYNNDNNNILVLVMTIDFVNFEMTLEVLGNAEDACEFFKTYERETVKDLASMRKFM